jgi:nucleotide-binding universal stress UspA family protein
MTPETHQRTIVVGYDGSAAARAAVEHAIDRTTPDGRLVLVHAYEVAADHVGASYSNVMLEGSSNYAASVLDTLEADCERLSTVEHERDVLTGEPAVAIIRAAEAREADEIIIGSRGLGRIRSVLGSVAHDVIHQAHCPVTVITERMIESSTAEPVVAAAPA